jgi:hypothetical protein
MPGADVKWWATGGRIAEGGQSALVAQADGFGSTNP